jgi:protein-disulfide isomerase
MRRSLLISALTAAALATGGAGAALAQKPAPLRKAPATQDWTKVVVGTAEGGFRMGNPNAPVKLVEYGSLTCPHCADFTKASRGPLMGHVRSGKLSFEFRNMVLNGIDLTASLLTRCAGPANFFPLTESIYATQAQWTAKFSSLTDAQKAAFQALPDDQKLGRIADIAGLTQLAAKGGMSPQQAKSCLADPAGLARLSQMYEAAVAAGITGTPSFLVNGAKVEARNWATLQPLLKLPAG